MEFYGIRGKTDKPKKSIPIKVCINVAVEASTVSSKRKDTTMNKI